MTRARFFLFISSLSFFILTSCKSNEIGDSKDVDPSSIYFDYQVWGDEDAGYMTVRLQYRFGGPGGTTLLLDKPGGVEFDGVELKADSSKMNGAYYEVIKPIADFQGDHTIIYRDRSGKQYKEEFSFEPISLDARLPDVVHRDDLSLDLKGMAARDSIRLLISDTATFSRGIDRMDSLENGHVLIKKDDLQVLINGPINMILSHEGERPVKNGTPTGGRLYTSYELKRQFELKD